MQIWHKNHLFACRFLINTGWCSQSCQAILETSMLTAPNQLVNYTISVMEPNKISMDRQETWTDKHSLFRVQQFANPALFLLVLPPPAYVIQVNEKQMKACPACKNVQCFCLFFNFLLLIWAIKSPVRTSSRTKMDASTALSVWPPLTSPPLMANPCGPSETCSSESNIQSSTAGPTAELVLL